MAEYFEVLEIMDLETRKGIGKYRRTVRADEPVSPPYGLCDHEHDTKELALICPDAIRRLPPELRPTSPVERLMKHAEHHLQNFRLHEPETEIEIIIVTYKKNDSDAKRQIRSVGDDLGGRELVS